MDADTLLGLQILRSESHPNAQMHGPDESHTESKENLSVYGLFHFLASTPQGKTKLRQMFLRPSLDLGVINERQKTIALLLRLADSNLLVSIRAKLKKIRNIRTSLLHIRKGVTLPPGRASMNRSVWSTLQRFAAYTIELVSEIQLIPEREDIAILTRVSHSLDV